MRGLNRANGLIAFGVMYALVLVLTLVSPNLFGLLGDNRYNVNTMDHVLHAVLAVASIGIGWWARSERSTELRRGM